MNCHPVGDLPRQGDENADFVGGEGSMLGHQPWHLPPVSMGWIGLSIGEVCAQLKDPERNGNRTLAEIQEHNATDGLVGWAWNPGKGRTPAPDTQEVFGELTNIGSKLEPPAQSDCRRTVTVD